MRLWNLNLVQFHHTRFSKKRWSLECKTPTAGGFVFALIAAVS